MTFTVTEGMIDPLISLDRQEVTLVLSFIMKRESGIGASMLRLTVGNNAGETTTCMIMAHDTGDPALDQGVNMTSCKEPQQSKYLVVPHVVNL